MGAIGDGRQHVRPAVGAQITAQPCRRSCGDCERAEARGRWAMGLSPSVIFPLQSVSSSYFATPVSCTIFLAPCTHTHIPVYRRPSYPQAPVRTKTMLSLVYSSPSPPRTARLYFIILYTRPSPHVEPSPHLHTSGPLHRPPPAYK